MSSGTYHFLRAERLLRQIEDLYGDEPAVARALALAQIHATLAAASPALFPAEQRLEREVAAELAEHQAAAAQPAAVAS